MPQTTPQGRNAQRSEQQARSTGNRGDENTAARAGQQTEGAEHGRFDSMRENLRESTQDVRENLQKNLGRAGEMTRERYEQSVERLQEGYERLRDDVDDLRRDAGRYARSHPAQTAILALALGLGVAMFFRGNR